MQLSVVLWIQLIMLLWDEVNTEGLVLPVISYLYLESFDGAKVNAEVVREYREKYARNYIAILFAVFYCFFCCDILFHFSVGFNNSSIVFISFMQPFGIDIRLQHCSGSKP